MELLIVPEGIEISFNAPSCISWKGLLIVPEGIEMCYHRRLQYLQPLLIVPEGIEISDDFAISKVLEAFNRTRRN